MSAREYWLIIERDNANGESGKVVNVTDALRPVPDHQAIMLRPEGSMAWIGWHWDGAELTDPQPPIVIDSPTVTLTPEEYERFKTLIALAEI